MSRITHWLDRLDKRQVYGVLFLLQLLLVALLIWSWGYHRNMCEFELENVSGSGVRALHFSYVSASEDGEFDIELSPKQESVLHVGFYLGTEGDVAIEAQLMDGSVVYGQQDAVTPQELVRMVITQTRIESR